MLFSGETIALTSYRGPILSESPCCNPLILVEIRISDAITDTSIAGFILLSLLEFLGKMFCKFHWDLDCVRYHMMSSHNVYSVIVRFVDFEHCQDETRLKVPTSVVYLVVASSRMFENEHESGKHSLPEIPYHFLFIWRIWRTALLTFSYLIFKRFNSSFHPESLLSSHSLFARRLQAHHHLSIIYKIIVAFRASGASEIRENFYRNIFTRGLKIIFFRQILQASKYSTYTFFISQLQTTKCRHTAARILRTECSSRSRTRCEMRNGCRCAQLGCRLLQQPC